MRINLGSKNPAKREALGKATRGYSFLSRAEINVLEVPNHVSKQPMSLEAIVKGAINRAKNSFHNCNYSFGIESGLVPVPEADSGYFNFSVCAIYDGKKNYLGVSPGFEVPTSVVNYILEKGMEMDEAFHACELTSNPDLGSSEGAIGLLTRGRIPRADYTALSITMALATLDNARLYKKNDVKQTPKSG